MQDFLNLLSLGEGTLISGSLLCFPIAVDLMVTQGQREAILSAFTIVCREWNKPGIGDAANNEALCPEKP